MLFTVLFFAIACIEGFLYYSEYENYFLLRLIMTLENGIKVFAFSPSISISSVVAQLQENTSPFQFFWIYAYTISVFGAQLCTATVALITIRYIFARNVQSVFIPLCHRDSLVLFGYNEYSKALIENLSRDSSGKNIVHLFHRENISERDEFALMKAHVVLHRIDITTEKRMDRKTRLPLDHAKKIILMDESAFRSAITYMSLTKLLSQPKECQCYYVSEECSARSIMEEFYDQERNASNRIPLSFISLSELYTRAMLAQRPLRTGLCGKDVHILIAGFGKLGQEILKQTALLGVNSRENRIWIDVVDRDAKHLEDAFMSRFNEKSIFHQKSIHDENVDTYYVLSHLGPDDHADSDGELRIQFISAELMGKHFRSLIQHLSEEIPFTYAAVCVEDPDSAMTCMITLQHFFNSTKNHAPIGVRLKTDSLLVNYLKQNQSEFQNVFPIGEYETALNLELLLSNEVDKAAKRYHETYERISGGDSIPQWDSLPYWKQNANRCASLYYKAYPINLDSTEWEEAIGFRKRFFGDADSDAESFCVWFARGAENPARSSLIERAATEHRRWNYVMALYGWRNADKGETRNDSIQVHTCMQPWEVLVQRDMTQPVGNWVVPYDFIPMLMGMEEKQ